MSVFRTTSVDELDAFALEDKIDDFIARKMRKIETSSRRVNY